MKIFFSGVLLCVTTIAFAQDAKKSNTKSTGANINPGTNAIASVSPAPPELKPLCFVDGKPISELDVALVEVHNITSIEILTDSVAVARYGNLAKDGVILIYTRNELFPKKKGRDPIE